MTAPLSGGVITFADGLPGFEASRRYVLIASPALDPFTCLRAVDAPEPSFLAINPRYLVPDYRLPLTAADRTKLRSEPDAPLLWLALINAHQSPATVNLRAPIVINPDTMFGVQVLTADAAYPLDHVLSDV